MISVGEILPCPACGFSLDGHAPIGTCPECGLVFDQATIGLRAHGPPLGWWQLFFPALVLAASLHVVSLFDVQWVPWGAVLLFIASLTCAVWAWQVGLRLAAWRLHDRLVAAIRGGQPLPRREVNRFASNLVLLQIIVFLVMASVVALVVDVLDALGLIVG